MSEAIWVAVIGIVGGAVGSFVAPWANWGVEQRRERLAHRRTLVREWRAGVAEFSRSLSDHLAPPDERAYLEHEWYLSLRPHLRDEPTGWNPDTLGEEIARIEQGWGLA